MKGRFEQRIKISTIKRRFRDNIDLIPFITLKYLSQKQQESKDNLGEFVDKYGFYFRDYELLDNIVEKQQNHDDSFISDFISSINALKNSSNPYIKDIYSKIPTKKLTDDVLDDIISLLDICGDATSFYEEVTDNEDMLSRRLGLIKQLYIKLLCRIVKEDHTIKNIYDPTCRDAENMIYLGNFESATLYEKEERLFHHAIQNMIMNEIPLDKVQIENKEIILDDSKMKYDAIISLPYERIPRIDDSHINEKFKEYNTKNPKILHLLNLIEHLDDDGILVTMTSLDLFVKRDAYNLRKCLIDRNILDAIIEYDKSYRNPHNIILIIKKNKENEDILFIKQNGEEHIIRSVIHPRKLYECYKERTRIARFSDIITNDEIRENDYNLNPKRYVYTLDYEPKDLGELTSKQQEYTSQIRSLDEEIGELLDKISKL